MLVNVALGKTNRTQTTDSRGLDQLTNRQSITNQSLLSSFLSTQPAFCQMHRSREEMNNSLLNQCYRQRQAPLRSGPFRPEVLRRGFGLYALLLGLPSLRDSKGRWFHAQSEAQTSRQSSPSTPVPLVERLPKTMLASNFSWVSNVLFSRLWTYSRCSERSCV